MKLFSKEVKIGLAGIAAIVVLFYGINFLKGINLFKSSNLYYVEFEDVCGLTNSSPVFADGYSIGIVRNIQYDYTRPKHVVVTVEVDKDMRIPAGSEASLETEMLGTVKMNLLLANNPRQRMEPGDTLKGFIDGGLMGVAADMVPKFEKLLPKMDSILTSLNALLADPALAQTLHNTEVLTANLSSTTAKLDRMMSKEIPTLTRNLNQVCENAQALTTHMDEKLVQLDVEGTMKRVDQTLANVEMLTQKLNSKDNTVGLLLNDPSLYNNLTATTANAASLLEDLKAHPKRYVHFSLFGKKDK